MRWTILVCMTLLGCSPFSFEGLAEDLPDGQLDGSREAGDPLVDVGLDIGRDLDVAVDDDVLPNDVSDVSVVDASDVMSDGPADVAEDVPFGDVPSDVPEADVVEPCVDGPFSGSWSGSWNGTFTTSDDETGPSRNGTMFLVVNCQDDTLAALGFAMSMGDQDVDVQLDIVGTVDDTSGQLSSIADAVIPGAGGGSEVGTVTFTGVLSPPEGAGAWVFTGPESSGSGSWTVRLTQ